MLKQLVCVLCLLGGCVEQSLAQTAPVGVIGRAVAAPTQSGGAPPGIVTAINPANAATNFFIGSSLSCASIGATAFVLTGPDTTNPPTTNGGSNSTCLFTVTPRAVNTTYYWKVVASNANGSQTATFSYITENGTFVATTGNDGNAGTQASPWRTISHGIANTPCGQSVFVRGGTYNGTNDFINDGLPSCTSWASALTVAAYPGTGPQNTQGLCAGCESVNLAPASSVGNGYLFFANANESYVDFNGINLDCSNMQFGCIHIESDASPDVDPHHMRWRNAEIKSSSAAVPSEVGIFSTRTPPTQSEAVGHHEILNNHIHGGGGNNGSCAPAPSGADFCHGVYINTEFNLIQGNELNDIGGACIQLSTVNGNNPPHDNIVRKNYCHDARNTVSGQRHWGVVTADGSKNSLIYDNLFVNIISNGSTADCLDLYNNGGDLVYNNTCYNPGRYGVFVENNSSNVVVRNNLLIHTTGTVTDLNDTGTSTTKDHNLCTSGCDLNTATPGFVNAAGNDFHLLTTSPAKDVGATIAAVPDDKDGVARPQGTAFDIGAYEFLVGGGGGGGGSSFTFQNTVVGTCSGALPTSCKTVSATAANHPANSAIVVAVIHPDPDTETGCTNTAGDTFLSVPSSKINATNTHYVTLYYVLKSNGNAADVVACTLQTGNDELYTIVENATYTNTASVDTHGTTTFGPNTSVNINYTTAQAHDWTFFVAVTDNGGTFSAGSGFTLRSHPNAFDQSQDQMDTPSGANTATISTGATNNNFALTLVAFKAL